MLAPGAVKFNTDHYILGSSFRAVYALRSYPTSTDDLALLRQLGARSGVSLHIYVRRIEAAEEDRILRNAQNRNLMNRSAGDLKRTVTAEANLRDVEALIRSMHRNNEPLVHCAVFIELAAWDFSALQKLQGDVLGELARAKLGADRLLLRQQDGFLAVNPAGRNVFGSQYERVLPASSAANLYPLNYSGKTDPHGYYIGKDRFGSDVILDPDRRAEDKTNSNVLILGNSGQGKSYLLKLLLTNIVESGKSVICLDAEGEMLDLCRNLNGCYVDLMSGQYIINPLEPKLWDADGEETGDDAPAAFHKQTLLSQHISFLKDFFRAYKDFGDRHIDVIELMLERLYRERGMDDRTDFSAFQPEAFPTLSDLYTVMEAAYAHYGEEQDPIYPRELLQETLLGLRSMCVGAESRFFNGHTNITSDRFVAFGVKELLKTSASLRNAMLFNVLSYMSDKLLTRGRTAAALDELYIWLSNPMTVEYIRNTLKRVRKKDSSVLMASQNLEDFDLPGVRELTRPLFAIPTHQFIFNCGAINKQVYMDNLQLEPSEYELIRHPQRGVCLFKCGAERFLLEVHAPKHKEELFGNAGGK